MRLREFAVPSFHFVVATIGILISVWWLGSSRYSIELISLYPLASPFLSFFFLSSSVVFSYFFSKESKLLTGSARLLSRVVLVLMLVAIILAASLVIIGSRVAYRAHAIVPAKVERAANSGVISIDGAIDPNLPFRLRHVIGREKSQTCSIELRSSGGFLPAALGAAGVINENKCSVHVAEFCGSACVSVWAGADRRSFDHDAVFAFHCFGLADTSSNGRGQSFDYKPHSAAMRHAGIRSDLIDVTRCKLGSNVRFVRAPDIVSLN